jgi:hypothetical protein
MISEWTEYADMHKEDIVDAELEQLRYDWDILREAAEDAPTVALARQYIKEMMAIEKAMRELESE